MRKIRVLICASLLVALLATSAPAALGIQGAEKDGKHALADDSGFLLTDYIYDDIMIYDDQSLYAVKQNGHWGFVDAQGNIVVPIVYDAVYVSFHEHLAPVKIGKKWGYVDDTGRLVIGPWFDDADDFSEGLACVSSEGLYGYIDASGAIVIPPQYEWGDAFEKGYAQVNLNDGTGLIDATGSWVLKPDSNVSYIHVDGDGLISVFYDDDDPRYYDLSSGTPVEIRSVTTDIDLSDYYPFTGKKVATLSEKRTLDKRVTDAQRLPCLDGATALFPVYAAFCQAVYPKATRYTDYYEIEENSDIGDALITCSKTNRAYERLIYGDADIIFVAQPSDEELKMAEAQGVEFDMIPIGKEAFVFIVNKENPLESITVDQIRGIYSGKITDWSALGVDGIGPIMAYQRPKNSGSQTALEALMGDTPLMQPLEGLVEDFMGEIVETIEYRNQPNAIGYSFRFFCTEMMGSEVKLLAIDGVEPTEENIRNGSYPITSTLYAIRLKGNDNPNVVALLDWIQSPQGMELVEKTGYTPWEY